MPKTGRMPSVSASRFSMVPRNDVPRSAFDIQHLHKTTFGSAVLVPIYVDEVLPGDMLSLNMHAFCRLSTPIVPVMDNLVLESFFFFVPCRLVWSNWERFMGEQTSPADTTVFLTPYVQFTTAGGKMNPGTGVADFMGITNNGSANMVQVSCLPFRAYDLIWNEWFRDQDFDTPITVATGDGPDLESAFDLRVRRKRHDYFTSARPWAQKPINADLTSTLDSLAGANGGFSLRSFFNDAVGAPVSGLGVLVASTTSAGPISVRTPGARDSAFAPYYDTSVASGKMMLQAGGTNLDPDVKVLVNDMRTAAMVQTFLERNARGGTRYGELLRSHFGVTPDDARLQRPEFLGGGRSMITISPVAQTSATGLTGGTTVAGNLSGVGTAVVTRHGFHSRAFTEHGYIIGMVNVAPDLTYQQGINRLWFRRTQFDFYWPALAHLGEQSILSKEIFSDGSAGDSTVFGYQERWSEYKYKPSRTSGFFRSTVATPLDVWHFGQEFSARPVMNSAFLAQDSLAVDRSLQTSGNFGAQFLGDFLFEARWVRPMPMFSIPGVGYRM